jgi:hypothetical protein
MPANIWENFSSHISSRFYLTHRKIEVKDNVSSHHSIFEWNLMAWGVGFRKKSRQGAALCPHIRLLSHVYLTFVKANDRAYKVTNCHGGLLFKLVPSPHQPPVHKKQRQCKDLNACTDAHIPTK